MFQESNERGRVFFLIMEWHTAKNVSKFFIQQQTVFFLLFLSSRYFFLLSRVKDRKIDLDLKPLFGTKRTKLVRGFVDRYIKQPLRLSSSS